MANLVVKFLLINPNNLLGDDLKDESVVKYSAGSNSIKIISSDSWTDIENSTSREKRVGVSRATNNTFVILVMNTTRIHDRKTNLVLNQVLWFYLIW